jgi:hypothetical protein
MENAMRQYWIIARPVRFATVGGLGCCEPSPASAALVSSVGSHDLLHPTTMKEALVGRVLLDVGCFALFRNILGCRMPLGSILRGLRPGIVIRPFVAAIGRRYRRHTGHCGVLPKSWGAKRQGLNSDRCLHSFFGQYRRTRDRSKIGLIRDARENQGDKKRRNHERRNEPARSFVVPRRASTPPILAAGKRLRKSVRWDF